MNMKKTIAAIAAGAVAVSAMATTASAITLETRTLTYNLVKSVEEQDTLSVRLSTTFSNVPLTADGKVRITVKNFNNWGDEVTVRGDYIDANKQVVQFSYTGVNNIWSDKFNAGFNVPEGQTYKVIDVVADNTNQKNVFIGGTAGVAETPAAATLGGTAIILTEAEQTAFNTAATADASYVYITTAAIQDEMSSQGSDSADVTLTANKYDGWYATGTTAAALATIADDAVDGSKTAALSKADAEGALDAAAAVTAKKTDAQVATATGLPAAKIATTTSGTALVVTAYDEGTAGGAIHANIVVEVKKSLANINPTSADIESSPKAFGGIEDVRKELQNGTTLGIQLESFSDNLVTNIADVTGGVYAQDFTNTKKTKEYPYKSTLTNSINDGLAWGTGVWDPSTQTGDVIQHIWTKDANSKRVDPAAVRSVINDCISKYDDVTFVFNTASKRVIEAENRYTDNSWEGTDKYMEFGRHYWDNDPGYGAGTVYITNDWIGNNLFSGALIVNGNLTLSLADAQKFDWTQKSLTFTWEAVQDTALTANQYANYVQNMVLRTSTDWYWDNFQVVLGETEVEEVESGAPVEGDVEDLPEDEEETDLGDVDEPEEEEEEEESEPAPEVAPAVESNPGTGNAPVALAVIPVALAAAAIVAKKRG